MWRDHAPFASLKWQRSNYELQGNTVTANSCCGAKVSRISVPDGTGRLAPAGYACRGQLQAG